MFGRTVSEFRVEWASYLFHHTGLATGSLQESAGLSFALRVGHLLEVRWYGHHGVTITSNVM
jgi:hypothetical protein